MNKVTLFKGKLFISLSLFLLVMYYVVLSSSVNAQTFTPINVQLGFGATGQEVRNLQTFLASDPSIYPQGLVTGYFGPLTRSAVMNFQSVYGISQVGRVGPQTLAKINSLIASGGYGSDLSGPIIYTPTVTKTNTTANFAWYNNEIVRGKVYYNSLPFALAEAVGNYSEPSIVGGTFATSNNLQTNHNISVQNLTPNTTYYYIIQSTDATGNVSVTWPATFKTN